MRAPANAMRAIRDRMEVLVLLVQGAPSRQVRGVLHATLVLPTLGMFCKEKLQTQIASATQATRGLHTRARSVRLVPTNKILGQLRALIAMPMQIRQKPVCRRRNAYATLVLRVLMDILARPVVRVNLKTLLHMCAKTVQRIRHRRLAALALQPVYAMQGTRAPMVDPALNAKVVPTNQV